MNDFLRELLGGNKPLLLTILGVGSITGLLWFVLDALSPLFPAIHSETLAKTKLVVATIILVVGSILYLIHRRKQAAKDKPIETVDLSKYENN